MLLAITSSLFGTGMLCAIPFFHLSMIAHHA